MPNVAHTLVDDLYILRDEDCHVFVARVLAGDHDRGILEKVVAARVHVHYELKVPIVLALLCLPEHLHVNRLLANLCR